MLEVKELTRSFSGFTAVDKVSFSVDKGEIVGLLGHNGAGKTTIMRMISGYLEPDRGSVFVDGVNLADEPKQIQASLGYLPETLPIYPELTVVDYLDYSAELKGLTEKAKLADMQRVITATEITSKLLSPISSLSRGYKQRLAVAQAILGRPRLLILDEPTNGLDPEQTHRMRDLIRELAKDATVILSTHIMQEVEALCSRVLIISAGALALDEQLANLRQSRHLLLECSLPVDQCRQLLTIEGVELVEAIAVGDSGDPGNCYRITLRTDISPKSVCARIATAMAQSQQQLYRLATESRDLETLFREVNDKKYNRGEMDHAA